MSWLTNAHHVAFIAIVWINVASSLAFAADPDWTVRAPKGDGTYKYYVGRSSHQDEAKAFQKAWRDAANQAIGENFGIKTRIETQTLEKSTDVTLHRRYSEISDEVELRDFEQIDAVRKDDSVWILYRYSLSAIQKEKIRLVSTKKSEKKSYSEFGTENTQNGNIEVSSTPEARVYIDNEYVGSTPLILKGRITAGMHMIRLQHPHYQTAQEQIIVPPNDTVTIMKALNRAKGALFITSDPVGGIVWIDNQEVGKTPIKIQGEAGRKYEIRVIHEEAEPLVTQTEISKYEEKRLDLKLVLKPSFVSVASEPDGATVTVNTKTVGRTPTSFTEAQPGKRNSILLKKPGYRPEELEIFIKGGEKKALDSIRLKPTGTDDESYVESLYE